MSAKNRLERAFDTLSKRKDVMSEDLIKRLRMLAEQIDPLFLGGPDARLLTASAAEIERLRAKLTEAEKVIEPFAEQGRQLEYGETGRTSIWEHPCATDITFDHLRAADEWMERGE